MGDNFLSVEDLRKKANSIRKHIIHMIAAAGTGHPGGSLSAADLVTALYFRVLRINPNDPKWPERDRFILSKGHASALWYAALALRGFFPEEELKTFYRLGSILQGHPDMRKTPGLDASTGSLGQGLSMGVGMALGCRMNSSPSRVFVLLGDGELHEGQVWEAAMAANHYKLDNLVAVMDRNNLCLYGFTENIMCLEDVGEQWKAFGWHVIAIDGHDMEQILQAFSEAEKVKSKPVIIIGYTTKGKGVPFMENRVEWHSRGLTADELRKALAALESNEGEA